MARFLRDLLDAEEPLFTQSLQQLEKLSGNLAADVKLIGDITEAAHQSMREMGLDPLLSTGPEVYRALRNRLADDNKRLAAVIGAEYPNDTVRSTPVIIEAARSITFDRRVFVLKHDKAKELLRLMPPKKLMKHLGYRNIERMFENEDFDELYTALRFSEGSDWLMEYNKQFASVTADDYEHRDMKIIAMDYRKYVDLADERIQAKLHAITHTKELGTVAIMPMKSRTKSAYTIITLAMVFHYMNEVKLYSTYFKLHRRRPHFAQLVADTLIADPDTHSELAGHTIHWRIVQRSMGGSRSDVVDHAAFTPHLQPGDIYWRRSEELLFHIAPELAFWKNRDYVGLMFDGFPVSFNLFDVAFAYLNDETYEHRYSYHFRESLWNEIFVRYMGNKNLLQQVIHQIQNDVVVPEKLRPPELTPSVKIQQKESRIILEKRKKMLDEAEGRLKQVSTEFQEVFDVLEKYEKTVTVFGSARLRQDNPLSVLEYDIAMKLAKEGYAIVTGGGHGLMEAANHGAFDGGGDSVGFNIILPKEQTLNPYTTDSFEFGHFFGRKVAMTVDASAYIYMPGGFGTFDELFEVLTLIQTRKMPKVPVILVGSKFWKPFDRTIRRVMVEKYHTVKAADTELYKITDNPDKVVEIVNRYHSRTKLASRAIMTD